VSRLDKHLDDQVSYDLFQEQVGKIYKDCQPFLRDISNSKYMSFLYSGRNSSKPMFEKIVRLNRKPTDTYHEIHSDLDDEFERQFGYPARSNSVFCTGDEGDAAEYGTLYMIFPQGKYKFLYSKEIGDLYIKMSGKAGSHGINNKNGLFAKFVDDCRDESGGIDAEFTKYYEEVTKEGSDQGHYQYIRDEYGHNIMVPKGTKDPIKYVKSQMEDPSEFWGVSLEWYPDKDYNEFYFDNYDTFLRGRVQGFDDCGKEKYDRYLEEIVRTYTNNNINKAIGDGGEIMITCKKYWALNAGRNSNYMYQKIYSYIKTFGIRGHKTQQDYSDWWANDLSKVIR
jgi:hypothetical protein